MVMETQLCTLDLAFKINNLKNLQKFKDELKVYSNCHDVMMKALR